MKPRESIETRETIKEEYSQIEDNQETLRDRALSIGAAVHCVFMGNQAYLTILFSKLKFIRSRL